MFKGEKRFKIDFEKDEELKELIKAYNELGITEKLSNDIKKYINKWGDKNYFYLNLNEYIKYKNKYLDYMYEPSKFGLEIIAFIPAVALNYFFVLLSRNFDYGNILLVTFVSIISYLICLCIKPWIMKNLNKSCKHIINIIEFLELIKLTFENK